MYRVLVLFLAVVATINGKVVPIPPMLSERILGGNNTSIENFPYQVSVHEFDIKNIEWECICGGSILNSRVIISAAHCFKGHASDYLIKYGSAKRNNGKTVKIARIDRHEGFNSNMDNDVAIIHLAEDIVFGPNAQLIALTSKSPAPDTNAVVSGWGYTSDKTQNLPDILQAVNVEIVDHTVCRKKFADEKTKNPYLPNVTDNMLCAGGYGGDKNSCHGDSGGPLVVNNELVGIVSWGYTPSGPCSGLGFPVVYADVAYLRQWIDDKIKQN